MKKIIFSLLILAASYFGFSQERSDHGDIIGTSFRGDGSQLTGLTDNTELRKELARIEAKTVVSLRDFLAIPNDLIDDTAAIQAALDFAEANKVKIIGESGTYIVSKAGELAMIYNNTTIAQSYCLAIGSHVFLDLNGATIRLADHQDASIFANKSILHSSPRNTNIQIRNGVLDSNGAKQRAETNGGVLSALSFINIKGLKLYDLQFDNCMDSALRFEKISEFDIDRLHVTSSLSRGFEFGKYSPTAAFDGRMKKGRIGSLLIENTNYNVFNSILANPVIATLVDVTGGDWVSYNSADGFKLQEGCENININSLVWEGYEVKTSTNTGTSSGIKIQGGAFAGGNPKNIDIGTIISRNGATQGLFIVDSDNVTIGSYRGINNAIQTVVPDARISDSKNIQISNFYSENSGNVGLTIASENMSIHSAVIYNPGAFASSAVDAVSLNGSNLTIESLTTIDDRLNSKMRQSFNASLASTSGKIGRVLASGFSQRPFSLTTKNLLVKDAVIDDDSALIGSFTLDADSSTTVANGNVFTLNRGYGYITPTFIITPLNQAARMLEYISISPTQFNGSGFTVAHPTATGSEKFRYELTGYMLTDTEETLHIPLN